MFIDYGGMTSLFIEKSILNFGLIVLSGDVDIIASQTTFISRMMTQLSLVRPGSCHGPLRHTRSSSLNLPPQLKPGASGAEHKGLSGSHHYYEGNVVNEKNGREANQNDAARLPYSLRCDNPLLSLWATSITVAV